MSDASKHPVYEHFLEITRSELEDILVQRSLSYSACERKLVARSLTAPELQQQVKVSCEEHETKLKVREC